MGSARQSIDLVRDTSLCTPSSVLVMLMSPEESITKRDNGLRLTMVLEHRPQHLVSNYSTSFFHFVNARLHLFVFTV